MAVKTLLKPPLRAQMRGWEPPLALLGHELVGKLLARLSAEGEAAWVAALVDELATGAGVLGHNSAALATLAACLALPALPEDELKRLAQARDPVLACLPPGPAPVSLLGLRAWGGRAGVPARLWILRRMKFEMRQVTCAHMCLLQGLGLEAYWLVEFAAGAARLGGRAGVQAGAARGGAAHSALKAAEACRRPGHGRGRAWGLGRATGERRSASGASSRAQRIGPHPETLGT